MSNTRIDLSPYINEIAKSSVYATMQGVRNAWVEEARSRLKSTSNDYIKGIRSRFHMNASQYSAEVYLEGTWANKLEQGFDSYDMKPLMSRSSKKKLSSEGNNWYVHVPFRHTTPSATGKTGTRMPNKVYRSARKLPVWGKLQSSGKGESDWGKYEGMTKVPETENSTRGAYFTWRTVSSKSPPTAFIHPGFKGVHIADDLASQIEDTFAKVFSSSTDHVLGNNKG